MKKNDWILLVSVLLYSYLFYEQAAGVNFLIFNLVIITGIALKKQEAVRVFNWQAAAVGAILSSIGIMVYSSPMAIITNIFSLGLLSVMSFSPSTSVVVALFLSICSVGASAVFMFSDMFKRRKNSGDTENKRPFYVKVIMMLIIVVITILFFVMYQTSNPLFKDFTKNINLDFISVPWVFFTLGGLVLLYGYYYNRHLGSLTASEINISNNLNQERVTGNGFFNRLFKSDTEYATGVILFVVLNVMLLVLNALDLNYLWFDGTLPEGIQHKEFVHDGVGTLIMSVVFAIMIILYFFRGRLNYYEKNKVLKLLTYVWIAQNAFMIFSTAYRMNMYVSESGISYKKIGVYVYLSLTLIGLITTYIKVSKLKTNWYLFRVNPKVYYAIMVISSLINWDVIITQFNINKALSENKKLEKYYLADLSFKNIPQLLRLNDTIKEYDDYEARDYYFSLRGKYFHSFKSALDKKLYDFLKEYSEYPGWQSYCIEKIRVHNDIVALNNSKQIKSLQLNNNYGLTTLKPVQILNNVEVLDLDNNLIHNLSELASFPNLKKLSLGSNQIDSIHKLPVLNKLTDLNLSGNSLNGITALKNLPNIKKLNLQRTSLNDLQTLPKFNNLSYLNLSYNAINDFSYLGNYKKLDTLEINNTFNGRIDSFPTIASLSYLTVNENGINPNTVVDFFNKLKHNTQLKFLALTNNSITNIYSFINSTTAQANFPDLQTLQLSNNKLNNLAGIGVHTQLEELYIGNNEIKSIEPLLKLRNLKVLSLEFNPVHDINGLEQLTELEYLNLQGCRVNYGISNLNSLNKLRSLNVTANHVSNLKPFSNLKQLTYLNLTDNKLRTIEGIEQLQNLEELYLTGNIITDVTPLYKLKKLKVLYLNKIGDVKLNELKKALPDCKIDDSYYSEVGS